MGGYSALGIKPSTMAFPSATIAFLESWSATSGIITLDKELPTLGSTQKKYGIVWELLLVF